jgi:putative Mg2+ transporter-C (MgtC) family protein
MKEIDLLVKMLPEIGVATVCGAVIGIERELKNKVAGVRTHVLICVGVAIFTLVGVSFGKTADPTRVIGQIITGIGFLGGGVIFKEHDKVTGVTSAAFIWFIASIGVLCGLGYLLAAGILTVGFLLITMLLTHLEHFVVRKSKQFLERSENKNADLHDDAN